LAKFALGNCIGVALMIVQHFKASIVADSRHQ